MDKIYCITNKINGKKYVGFTTRPLIERISEHFSPASDKSGYAIHKAIKKYGKENFDCHILYEGDDALDKEDYYIRKFGNYNMTGGGNIPPNQKGKTWSLSSKTKSKMSLSSKGKPKSDKHKQSMSESRKGRKPWNKGLVGVQESIWKGQRNSPMTSEWKIAVNNTIILVENLSLWCEQNGYNKNTVKYHYYKKTWPYKDIQHIEKVN